MARKPKQKDGSRVTIPVEWPDTVDLPAVYANQLHIQHTGNEFFLTFGELQPPIVVGSEEERQEKLGAIPAITVRPVAKIAISPPAMMAMADVIRENVDRFTDAVEKTISDLKEEGQ